MGIFYLDARIVSKAKQSAIAKAAYTSNEKLYSERDEEYKQYKTRSVKPESFIMAPTHAPDWVMDREKLWNEVEKVEKNVNAQLLREIVVALPDELSDQQQSELVKEYVQENFVSDGMVADVNIHRDKSHNPHAHILLTVRPFNQDGTWWENRSKKEYILDDKGDFTYTKKGKKRSRKIDLTGWNSKDKLLEWRKNFAEKANEYYKKNEIDESISHLSYEEQGLDKIGHQRLTRNEYHVEKSARENAEKSNEEYIPVTHYGQLNTVIESYNEQIEMINSKVVSLEEYKQKGLPRELAELAEIRRNYPCDDIENQGNMFVRKREKTNYVDYSIAKNAMDSISYWKRTLDKRNRAFEREKAVIQTVISHYQEGKKDLFKFGFVANHLKEQVNEKALMIEKEFENLSSKISQYEKAYSHVDAALNFQKGLLAEEFNYLYPEYEELSNSNSDEAYRIMDQYVSNFRSNEIKYEIKEVDRCELFDPETEFKFRDSVRKNIENYSFYSKQHFSLPKNFKRKESEYINAVKENQSQLEKSLNAREKIYAASVEYLTVKNELEHVENQYEQVRNSIYKDLITMYGSEQETVIQRIPDRVKINLLKQYLDRGYVHELHADLDRIQFQLWEPNKKNNLNSTFEKHVDEESSQENYENVSGEMTNAALGNLLSELIQQAQHNEHRIDSREKERRKEKRRWRVKNNEIGMDR